MVRSTTKYCALLLLLPLLTSCATIVEEIVSPIVAADVNNGLNKTKPDTGKSNTRQKAKEEEQLKAAGKCPVCRGQGRSSDGQYVCSTCNGTGKYTSINNTTE